MNRSPFIFCIKPKARARESDFSVAKTAAHNFHLILFISVFSLPFFQMAFIFSHHKAHSHRFSDKLQTLVKPKLFSLHVQCDITHRKSLHVIIRCGLVFLSNDSHYLFSLLFCRNNCVRNGKRSKIIALITH